MNKKLAQKLAYTPPAKKYNNLSTNENFAINHDHLMNLSIAEILDGAKINEYGESNHKLLRENYASYMSVDPDEILPVPGSESLISVLLQAFATRTLLTFETDFFRYAEVAEILRKRHIKVPNATGIGGLIKSANEHPVDLIMLSNPNNPLGNAYLYDSLVELLENTDCYVVIDEAYGEFYSQTVVPLINKYDKLMVMRTMSKGWGAAGLRVGFLLANKALIDYTTAFAGPFILPELTALVAAKILDNAHLMKESVAKIIAAREEFISELTSKKFVALPSETNFVFIKSEYTRVIADILKRKLVIVPVFKGGIRVTIGDKEHLDTVIEVLEAFADSRK